MGRHLAGPRLLRWGPKGQKAWYAFYPDRIARMLFHDTVLTGQDLLDVRENLGRTYGVTYI
jgi:hypothetical protein